MLLFGGTNAMAQLRESMQTIWHMEEDSRIVPFADLPLFRACYIQAGS